MCVTQLSQHCLPGREIVGLSSYTFNLKYLFMKVIEFVGCEGVGKSTLYKTLTKNYLLPKKVIKSATSANHLIARHLLGRDNSLLKYSFIPGIKIPFVNNFISYRVLNQQFKKELFRDKKEWEECIHILFAAQSNIRTCLRSFYSYSALLTRMEQIALYEKYLDDKFLLMEPGIFHKLNNILMFFDEENVIEITGKIFSILPVIPYGLIFLDTSPEIIFERFYKREEIKSKWKQEFMEFYTNTAYNKTIIEQRIIKQGVKILRERGARVVEINSEENIDVQASLVMKFFSELPVDPKIHNSLFQHKNGGVIIH